MRERVITVLTRVLAVLLAPYSRPPETVQLIPTARVLVLKPCCLGDVLMTTPALAALRLQLPRARITYAVSRYARSAISSSALIDHVLDVGPVGTTPPRSLSYLMGYARLVAAMRSGRYDACLVFDRSPLLTVLPLLAGIPLRAGIDSAGRGFALNLRVPWAETVHESELYLRVARVLGIADHDCGLSFTPTDADEAAANLLWQQYLGAAQRNGPVVALAPGGGVNPGMALIAKRWPASRYAALARRLATELNATVLLVGGATDAAITARVAADAGVAAVHDLSGLTNLGSLGALLRRCRLFVGNDSAPMHLAAAVGRPVVALFGPTNPAMYAPYSRRAIVLTPTPASDAAAVTSPTHHGVGDPHDVASIAVDTVWDACLQLLERYS